ncbi:MAG: hypothetical protein COT16_02990 [Elusimicrobia bacterium CG08_land_8_20_14_0_20_44_26]|nr:MAG: hypothetical protein COT16_02990 [Elusimicrobia bacterium CG08_land_8_20_14_0_20_44_26]
MKGSISKISENIHRAIEVIRELRIANEKLKKENMILLDQMRAIENDSKISARAMKDFERMKLERIKIKDKIGVMLNSLQDVK